MGSWLCLGFGSNWLRLLLLSSLHLLLLLRIGSSQLLLILSLSSFLLSLDLHLHLSQLGLSVGVSGVSLLHQTLNVCLTGLLLLGLHLHVLHLLGSRQLLLLKHLLMLNGGSILLSGHLVLLLIALWSILNEMSVLTCLDDPVLGGVGHSVSGWWDVLALVSVVKLLALFKYSVTATLFQSVLLNLRRVQKEEKLTYLVDGSEVLSTILVDVLRLISEHFSRELVEDLWEFIRNRVFGKVLACHLY